VAEYSQTLLEALRKLGPVSLGASKADVHLYHLGNNQLHRGIYERALAKPGVVVLHDAVLHHFFLGSLDRSAYIDEFIYNYGEWQRSLAEDMWVRRPHSAIDPRYFRYPMLRRIAVRSRAVIVHNPGAARMVLEHAPQARVHEIPHLWRPAPEMQPTERESMRQRRGLTGHVYAVLGHLRESKRVPAVIRAFDWVRRQNVMATLLLAGEFASPNLERALTTLMQSPGVIRAGYTAGQEFWRLAALADSCVSLRNPAAGETSGITVRLMGSAKPVIVTDSEEVSRYPGETCLKVAPGVAEQSELGHYMLLLAQSPVLAGEIGRRAAAWIREHHDIGKVADAYWKVLCEYRD
jgi:glycosyltransferase involved in cell wall biosynthesis